MFSVIHVYNVCVFMCALCNLSCNIYIYAICPRCVFVCYSRRCVRCVLHVCGPIVLCKCCLGCVCDASLFECIVYTYICVILEV